MKSMSAFVCGAIVFAGLGGCGGETMSEGTGGAGGAGGSAAFGGSPAGGYGGAPIGGMAGYVTGGTGGTVVGGYGGMPPGGGGMPFGGSGGSCGANCPSWKLGGLISLNSCCAASGQCGALVDPTVSSLAMLPQGCHAIGQPGTPDASCPPLKFTNPLDGTPAQYPGCCRKQSGTCGVSVDLTPVQGPFMGCMDLGAGQPAQPCGSATPDCSTCVQNQCAFELSACTATPACMSIFNCLGGCTDQACADKCIASYPAGQAEFWKFQSCVQAKCAVQCGA